MPAKIASQKSSTSASASWRKSSKKVGSSTARGKDGGTSRRRRLGSGSLNRDVEKDKGDGEDDNGGESSDDDVGDEIEGAADAADAASGDSVEQGSRLRQFTMGDFKLSMWIPSDLAGRVIGKKGTVISNMQKETKAKLINALPPEGDTLWIAVAIVGGMQSLKAAYKAISDLVEGEVDECVLEFIINYRRPFFLHGTRKFGTLKHISASTNVRIFFPEFNPKEQAFSQAKPVSLEGEFENVCEAVKLFDSEASLFLEQQSKRQADVATGAASKPSTAADGSHAEERTPPNHELASSAATMQEMEQTAIESKPQLDAIETAPSVKRVRVEKQIDIPESLVGLLLSKKGNKQYSTMNSIQKYTHTYISKLRAKKREIQGEDDANEDVATEQGGGEAASAEKQLNAVLDNDSEGDNRRNASKGDEVSVANDIGGDGDDRDDENDNGDDDNENSDDDDDDSDFDDAREPDEASNGSDVNSNNDSEDFESAGEGSPKTKTDKAGEQKRVVVNESYPVESADKATPAQTKTDEARVASAPSGGAVTFVVVSNAEESVDMVIRALQRIINGDPIKIVMENLREEGKKFARIFAQKRSESAAAAVGGASAAAEVPKGKAFNGVRKRGGRSSKSKTNTGKDAMSGDGSAQLKPARTESGKASKSSRKRVASDSASGVAGGDDAVGDAVRGERGDRGPRGSRVGRGGNNAKPRSGPPSSPTTATGQAPTADKAKVAAEASAAGGGGSSMGVFKKRL